MSALRLMGVETEYALVTKNAISTEKAGKLLLDHCKSIFPSLKDQNSEGIFLSNGGRMYLDGTHPEFCTPECSSPEEVVGYLVGYDDFLRSLGSTPLSEKCEFFKHNVDYVSQQTWGCHESYLHRMNPIKLAPLLIPHLVTRVLYTGAGGLDPFRESFEFVLSPRSAFLAKVTGPSSTTDRPIFHTKDESLAGGDYHRCHIIYGESLCSHLSMFLKCGTTALIIALAEANLIPLENIALEEPLLTAKVVAGDLAGFKKFTLANGLCTNAWEMQHYYLRLAQIHQNQPFMPSWAGQVCNLWQKVLNAFIHDPSYLRKSLDAYIKWNLFTCFLMKNNLTWERINEAHRELKRVCRQLDLQDPGEETILRPDVQKRILSSGFLSQERLQSILHFTDIRRCLFVLDMEFSRLRQSGIFHTMDESGALEHRLSGVKISNNILKIPPKEGRARVRGLEIDRLSRTEGTYIADWGSILDRKRGRKLDLSDPFGKAAYWQNCG
ncbi:MAG: proteasome accessory factor PafA2 family protein [Candidatus Brocadiae bacterium]|nr:proteasome accessory factor PafA2 family protein [Candidatus Brocadiia bacterium]